MTMDITTQKAAARKAAFARRKDAHQRGLGKQACENLHVFLVPFQDQPISAYMPIRTEVDATPVMAAHSRAAPVGVPVILGAGLPLEFHRWSPEAVMKSGPFGAMVPVERVVMTPRVVVLPLVAFDCDGRRLGYGGGYYDRTLEILRAAGPVTAVGFAYSAQEASDLPVEPTDQPLDAIVTETGTRRFTP